MAIKIGDYDSNPPFRNRKPKPEIQQESGRTLMEPQLERIKHLASRLIELTEDKSINWRVSLLGSSSFFYYEDKDTQVKIHRHGMGDRDHRSKIEIEVDGRRVGEFNGTMINKLGDVCEEHFGKVERDKHMKEYDKIIGKLDKVAESKKRKSNGINTDALKGLSGVQRQKPEQPPTKVIKEGEIPPHERDAFFREDSYDKEKNDLINKSSEKLGKLAKNVIKHNPITMLIRAITGDL